MSTDEEESTLLFILCISFQGIVGYLNIFTDYLDADVA